MLKHLVWLILTVTTLLIAPGATAESRAGDPLLTVALPGDATESDKAMPFDLAALAALGEVEFTTTTIWTDDAVRFTGVRLRRLLEALDIRSGTLELLALNDYMIEIEVAEARNSAALIAYRMNGTLMSPRNKGPLWLVYPYDSDVKFQSETFYSKSIWQMDRIVVRPPGG